MTIDLLYILYTETNFIIVEKSLIIILSNFTVSGGKKYRTVKKYPDWEIKFPSKEPTIDDCYRVHQMAEDGDVVNPFHLISNDIIACVSKHPKNRSKPLLCNQYENFLQSI